MKTRPFLFILFISAMLLISCNLTINGQEVSFIEPSDTIITEERPVGSFTAIEFSTFGRLILTQGETETLAVRGSDNIVPLVKTSVSGGVLKISMDEDVNITGLNSDNVLTFTITLKSLNNVTISGAGKVEMDRLVTSDLRVELSGAGQFVLDDLMAETLDVSISGVGNVEIAGEVTTAKIDISGAGPVNCPDLKIQTAEVTISGIGGATIWVTDQLTGEISGGGSVSYYGDPHTSTQSTGIGSFKPLGEK